MDYRGNSLAIAVGLVFACASTPSLSGGLALDSREYKMLLKAGPFSGSPEAHAAKVWEEDLKPMIARDLDRRNNGEVRSKKSFALKHRRRIEFKDTATCELGSVGLSYRERAKWSAESGAEHTIEATLKLRGPDAFLVNALRFKGDDEAKAKLEEDLSPGLNGAARHKFAYSVSQKGAAAAMPTTLSAIDGAFPGASDVLNGLAKAPPANGPLVSGKVFIELVYSGAKVDLGDTDAEFDLTFWYPAEAASLDKPAIVEISFSYDTDDGNVDRGVALRGTKLFQGLAATFGSRIETSSQSKTSVALPTGCRED
jgi:hypothetical protein